MYKSYDYETLKLLRKKTILNPIAYIKVLKARQLADVYQRVINQVEHCDIGVDYSKANELEYNLRFKSWMNCIMPTWYKYASNQDLYDFSYDMLMQSKKNDEMRLIR